MLLTVPNAALAAVLASPDLIRQTFPAVHEEVMMLIHLLQATNPSLADVLAWGIISMLTPASRKQGAAIGLACRQVVLSAIAGNKDGVRVLSPHDRPQDVTRLEVVDLAVAGRSCLGATG
ncbi:hypothetical protein [Amycolatopsis kentuckyensis]|uniref:hypothetical protein n=1 Tax=Amycolatopsis kentuckyensis TaxID=218823 RepID=UPI000A3C5914|nr:hypothetical protein [Amycolatopsis kentuckyensis]